MKTYVLLWLLVVVGSCVAGWVVTKTSLLVQMILALVLLPVLWVSIRIFLHRRKWNRILDAGLMHQYMAWAPQWARDEYHRRLQLKQLEEP